MVVALILVAVGLAMAGIICVLWHRQGERYRQWLEGEGARGTEEQGWGAKRNGQATLHSVHGPPPKGVQARGTHIKPCAKAFLWVSSNAVEME